MLKPCDQWNASISAYLDNELDAAELAALQEHLAHCDACRTALELYRCDQQDASAALLSRGTDERFAGQVLQKLGIPMSATETIAPIIAGEKKTSASQDADREEKQPRRSFGFRFLEWAAVTGLALIVVAVIFPVFAKAHEKARSTQCTSNQRQIALAINMYATENREILPSANNWVKEIRGIAAGNYQDHSAPELKIAYAYNIDVSAKSIGQIPYPPYTPLTYDARNSFPDYRHNGGIIASFVDGHVAYFPRQRIQDIINGRYYSSTDGMSAEEAKEIGKPMERLLEEPK